MSLPDMPNTSETESISIDELLAMGSNDQVIPAFVDEVMNKNILEQGKGVVGIEVPNPLTPNMFQRIKKHWRKALFVGALGAGTIAGVQLADQDLSALKSVDITKVGRNFIDTAESAAPIFLAGAGLQVGAMALTKPGRKNLKMSYLGLNSGENNVYKTVASGLLLPTIGIGALSTALMIEDGIHRGANRNISSITTNIESENPGKKVMWTLQKGTNHFMNDSDLSPQIFISAQNHQVKTNETGSGSMAPFYRDLVTLPTPYSANQASMIISASGASPIIPKVKEGAICEVKNDRCELKGDEIIVDEGEGFKIGDNIDIRGHEFKVVGFSEEDQSLVNRLIAFTGVSEEMTKKDYYGFVSLAENKEQAQQLIRDLELEDQLDVLNTEEFMGLNEDFWSHNGTPLLILLIGDIAIFAGVTFSAMKKFEQERDRPVLATLRAIGASESQIAQQQYARTTIQISKGIIPGAAVAGVTTAAINNLLPGFSGEITPRMIAASGGVALLVQMGATSRGLLAGRKRSLAQEMKAT